MDTALDLPFEAFCLQWTADWRLSDQEVVEKLLDKFPDSSLAQLESAAKDARRLYQAAGRCNVYHEPSAETAREAAVGYLQKEVPGLSERAYSLALHPILYSWMK